MSNPPVALRPKIEKLAEVYQRFSLSAREIVKDALHEVETALAKMDAAERALPQGCREAKISALPHAVDAMQTVQGLCPRLNKLASGAKSDANNMVGYQSTNIFEEREINRIQELNMLLEGVLEGASPGANTAEFVAKRYAFSGTDNISEVKVNDDFRIVHGALRNAADKLKDLLTHLAPVPPPVKSQPEVLADAARDQ